MANFSSDAGKPPPARFTPRAGNIGAKAAEQALKSQRGQAPGGAQGSSGGLKQVHPRLGHPDALSGGQGGSQGQQDDQPQDNRHLEMVGGWTNMRGLGRDVPFTVWAGVTGSYRQFA